jgi:hypothetical protein
MEENLEEEVYTSDEVDYIVKKVRNHQSNLGILITIGVVVALYIYHHI